MSLRDPLGQYLLALGEPPCDTCFWKVVARRCSGPHTLQSQVQSRDGLLTCFQPATTTELLQNLEQHCPSSEEPTFRSLQGLPAAIPMLCEGMPSKLQLDPTTLYGIGLDDLVRENGRIRFQNRRALLRAFRLPSEARLCLIASVRDTRLENLWHRSAVDSIWRRIRRFGFEFVTGLSFSVFEEQSRNGQLTNQERNMRSVQCLARAGVTAVPLFCEVFEEDLAFAAKWLNDRPSLGVVAGLAQSWKTDEEFSRFLYRMKALKEQVTRPLHFLIVGCSAADRIRQLFQELGSVTITNKNLAISGVNGAGWDPGLNRIIEMRTSPREEVIRSSFQSFSAFCEGCAAGLQRVA